MGFFSDLKEDLSQAVNELIPDEEKIRDDETNEIPTDVSLDEMLKNIDEYRLPEELLDGIANESNENDILKDVEAALSEDVETADLMPAKKDPSEENTEDQTESEPEMKGEMEELLDSMLSLDPIAEDVTAMQENKKDDKESQRMEMENRIASDETSVITVGMVITGDIVTEGSIEVVGTVNGNIDALGKLNITGHVNGNSKASDIYAESAKINGEVVSEGAVKIGASSVIIGNITATSAAIAGAVKGDIDVKGPVILDASAIVMGNIKSKSVQINNGAVIEGMCSQCYADVSPTSFFDDYKPDFLKGKSK